MATKLNFRALMLLVAAVLISISALAQSADVTYLEKVGKGGTRVFAVQVPVKDEEVIEGRDKAKLKPEERACYEVIKAILFDGVNNYNQGMPLVHNSNDSFALSVVNPKSKAFMSYCKKFELENSDKNKYVYHYIIEVNHYNLLRLLDMRGSHSGDFLE